jgi:ribonuclease HII
VDEAGRGPLAGPIVAGAVVLHGPLDGLDDSKRLTERRRERLFAELEDGPHEIGVAILEAEAIDLMGIQPANYRVMAEAARALPTPPEFLLVDGFAIRGTDLPQKRIVKGDQRSHSIAAASIIAKVTRDRIMRQLAEKFPGYGFEKHKGYGTRAHIEALDRLGPCPVHRKSFAPISRSLETAPLFRKKDRPS